MRDDRRREVEMRLSEARKQIQLAVEELEAREEYGNCATLVEAGGRVTDVLDDLEGDDAADTPHPHAGGGQA